MSFHDKTKGKHSLTCLQSGRASQMLISHLLSMPLQHVQSSTRVVHLDLAAGRIPLSPHSPSSFCLRVANWLEFGMHLSLRHLALKEASRGHRHGRLLKIDAGDVMRNGSMPEEIPKVCDRLSRCPLSSAALHWKGTSSLMSHIKGVNNIWRRQPPRLQQSILITSLLSFSAGASSNWDHQLRAEQIHFYFFLSFIFPIWKIYENVLSHNLEMYQNHNDLQAM